MTGVATPLRFGRERINAVLTDNGLGEFVGMHAIITDGMDSTGRDCREFDGWRITGTAGYAEVDRDGWVCLTGVWLPPEVIGK